MRWWDPPALPRRHGRRSRIVLKVTAGTLAGAEDQPGELTRFGPVPASTARRLAEHAEPAELTAPAGAGACRHDGSPTPYVPSRRLRDQVTVRDEHCRHPHCRRPAIQCDLDHLAPHRPNGEGGPTCACNLVPLCRFHHRLEHRGGWRVRPVDPRVGAAGPLHWTSALGRTYRDTAWCWVNPALGEPRAG